MANGLPYTIAAQIAYPDRQCIGFVGDGGFTMLMGEFATAVQIPTADQDRSREKQYARTNQVGADGFPRKSRIWLRSQSNRFRGFAQACGGTGFRIEDPATAAP